MDVAEFWTILRDGHQNPFSVGTEYCEFQDIGGIEEYIGIFLERIDPFDLGSADVRPVGDGFLSGESSFVEIS